MSSKLAADGKSWAPGDVARYGIRRDAALLSVWPFYVNTVILNVMNTDTKSTILVSSRGQITLPADVRLRLGIKEGGVVTLEERNGELILRPAAVVELTMYSDGDIVRWDAEDELTEADRRRIKKKLARKS